MQVIELIPKKVKLVNMRKYREEIISSSLLITLLAKKSIVDI